jgi:hypothetical protein
MPHACMLLFSISTEYEFLRYTENIVRNLRPPLLYKHEDRGSQISHKLESHFISQAIWGNFHPTSIWRHDKNLFVRDLCVPAHAHARNILAYWHLYMRTVNT